MSPLSTLSKHVGRGARWGVLCALAAWLLTRPPLLKGIDEWLFDGCFHARGPRPTQARVVLVGLDAVSLDQLGKPAAFLSPELAEVVRSLKQQGAAAIGIDLIVPASLEQSGEYSRFLEADPMGQAIMEAGNVVLAKEWLRAPGDGTGREGWLLPLTPWRLKSLADPEPTDLGFLNLTEDRDHFFRRQQLVGPDGDLHFALALYAVANHLDVRWEHGLWVGDRRVPLDEDQCLRVNFVGPPGTFPVVPFADALAAARGQRPPPVDVQGAVVLVGATSRSMQDYHATPFGNRFYPWVFGEDSGLMAGTELHGHILATLVDGAYLRPLPGWLSLLLLLAVGSLLGDLLGRLNLEWGTVTALVHHLGWLAVALAAFAWFRLRVEMVPMLLLGILVWGFTFGLRWRRLRGMLGVVQSEAIARSLEAAASPQEVRGQTRIVTVLFADVRNFTSFAESHSPQDVVALLNAYFGAIVPVIEEHGGTLNTYMGDGIMVIFGAPEPCPDHALRAVRCAVAILGRVRGLRERWAALGFPGFRIGLGMHTGEVVIGMVGSPSRLHYTAIGDTVNGASRIEAENKQRGTDILLSAQTRDALPEAERYRLGVSAVHAPVLVKGKSQPLDVYPIDVPAANGRERGPAPAAAPLPAPPAGSPEAGALL